MSKMPPLTLNSCFIDKTRLVKLKQRAMRQGVWFRGLRRIDRVLIELTMKVSPLVRSQTLANSIKLIFEKLEHALENTAARLITEIGVPLARKLSLLGLSWGHKGAWEWADNINFAKYLAVMMLNNKSNTTT